MLLHSECRAGKTVRVTSDTDIAAPSRQDRRNVTSFLVKVNATTISTFSPFQFKFIYLPEKKYIQKWKNWRYFSGEEAQIETMGDYYISFLPCQRFS